MDDFKRKAATKERGNNIAPPRRKDPKENKRQRSRIKRELPKPPVLDRRAVDPRKPHPIVEAVQHVLTVAGFPPSIPHDIAIGVAARVCDLRDSVERRVAQARTEALEEAVSAIKEVLPDKPAFAKDLTEAIRARGPKDGAGERMIPESHARWIADEIMPVEYYSPLSDEDWASLVTEAADACSTKSR